jgi:hypothetical protein
MRQTVTAHLTKEGVSFARYKCRFVIELKLDSLPLGLDGILARLVRANWRHRIDDRKCLAVRSIRSLMARPNQLRRNKQRPE